MDGEEVIVLLHSLVTEYSRGLKDKVDDEEVIVLLHSSVTEHYRGLKGKGR